MCIIWKALCQYVLDARLALWVSLEYTFTHACTTNKAERRSGAVHIPARQEHEGLKAIHIITCHVQQDSDFIYRSIIRLIQEDRFPKQDKKLIAWLFFLDD